MGYEWASKYGMEKGKKRAMVCYFHMFWVSYARHSITQPVIRYTELYAENQYTVMLTIELGRASK